MSNQLHCCFLLHQRAYRETSVIVDLLTETEGRVSVVCKGVRGAGNKAALLRSTLQPFTLLSVAWSGKSNLKSLRSAETISLAPRFLQHQLYAALYLNELIMRLFQQGESHLNLFSEYQNSIANLAESSQSDVNSTEIPLRKFEFKLLEVLGFEIDLYCDAMTGEPIDELGQYHFHNDFGLSQQPFSEFIPDTVAEKKQEKQVASQLKEPIAGQHILALQKQDYSNADVRRASKKLMRAALSPHLGGRALKSRELYAKVD